MPLRHLRARQGCAWGPCLVYVVGAASALNAPWRSGPAAVRRALDAGHGDQAGGDQGALTAVRVGGDAFRSVHNDTDDEAELLIFSPRLDQPPTEKQDDFWPST